MRVNPNSFSNNFYWTLLAKLGGCGVGRLAFPGSYNVSAIAEVWSKTTLPVDFFFWAGMSAPGKK